MKYDLFISDFDGTLGELPANIDEETVEAIKKYTKKGGKFAIVSGRHFESIKEICSRYQIKGIVATYQGAEIRDVSTGETLYRGGLDYRLSAKIVKRLQEDGCMPSVYLKDTLYYTEYSPYIAFHESSPIKIEQVKDLVELVLEKGEPVLKICGVSERAYLKVAEYSKDYPDVIVNSGVKWLIEVINPKDSKGGAVKFICNYYNIPFDRTIAVGDSSNDIMLLKGDWHGVAVGDADEQLKAVAKEITVPYAQKPVKILLEKYCLKEKEN